MKDCKIMLTANGRFTVKAPPWYVNACRAIPSRRFSSARKEWVAPVTRLNSTYLLQAFAGAQWSPEARSAAEKSANPPQRVAEPFPSWYVFRTQPYDHQRDALTKMWPLAFGGLFMEMGTGKTKTLIDLFCARAMDGQINAALIVAPLSVILSWRDEILTHSTISGTIARVRSGRATELWPAPHGVELADGFTWFLANIEGLSVGGLTDAVLTSVAGRTFAMAVDESSRIKNHEAARTRSCQRIGDLAAHRYIASGLPTLKGPLDLYSQLQFLSPDITGTGDFYCFRNRYAVMGGYEGREVIGYQNLPELAEATAPYVYQITKKEALSLPDKVYKTVRVELTTQQKQQIRAIKAGMIAGKDPLQSRSLKNVLEKVLRIQQIASGAVLGLGEGDSVVAVPGEHNPKIDALRDIVEEFDGQFVVWCSFIFEVDAVCKLLDTLGVSHYRFTGETDPSERKEMIDGFQSGQRRAFVATVQAGGIGITLTKASLAVYMSNSWSLEARAQSEDRTHRIGQVNKVEYVDIIAEKSVDDLVREALSTKRDLAEHIRSLIKNGDLITGIDT